MEPEPIKVLRKKEAKKEPLKNIFELAKVMRAHRESKGPLGRNQHGKSSEISSRALSVDSEEKPRPLLDAVFPRLRTGRKKTGVNSDIQSRKTQSDRSSLREPCNYTERAWCVTHSQPWPCSG